MLCVQPGEPAGLIQRFVYACQLRQWESQCGMRRPSLGQNEDDLSRLTTVISPTTASLSSAQTEHEGCDNNSGGDSNSNCGSSGKQHLLQQQHGGGGVGSGSSDNGAISTVSQYLPNLINSSEWQNCRKRKERQDSTSSISQDRKLIRSNSEEHLPNCGEVIRRVSSHEDFKKPSPLIEISVNKENIIEETAEEQHQLEEQQIFEKNLKNSSENLKKFFIGSESLCAASREGDGHTQNKSDNHHHHLSQSNHLSHHNHYTRHRLSPCRDVLRSRKDSDSELDGEHERRRHCERFSKTRPPPGRKSVSPRNRTKGHSKGKDKGSSGNDHFYSKHDSHHSIKHERRGYGKRDKASDREKTPEPELLSDYNDNNLLEKGNGTSPREKQLPWDQSFQDDTPVVCQRFADHNFEHATKMGGFGEVRSLPPNATMKHHISYRSAEVHPTTQKPIPQANNMFDERIKAINRKLSTLKKKLTAYEDRFERENGFRPAHGDKTSDSSIRPVVVEIHKLRKEKNQIKADLAVFNAKAAKLSAPAQPAAAAAAAGTADEKDKLYQMKDTIADIEKRLQEKRDTDHRSENLESLSGDQLVEEKASVQRALLYLESIYGRPASREERDAARPLYDRYRVIKRLVNRANSISGPCGVNSQMPTILEHEALAIVGTPTPSTDISPPSANSMVQSPTDTSVASTAAPSTDESETTSSSITENIHSMTVEELWEHYDAAREEKKELRRAIKEFEQKFEESTGRKMLKSDRKMIEETYAQYKQKKAKLRLIDALFKKQMSV